MSYGPYPSLQFAQMAYLDPVTGTLYWIDSITNVGDVWGYYQGVCGVPGPPPPIGAYSWVIVINVLTAPPALVFSQITTAPLPFSWDGTPDGTFIVAASGGVVENFYIGGGSGSGGYRWHKVNRMALTLPARTPPLSALWPTLRMMAGAAEHK